MDQFVFVMLCTLVPLAGVLLAIAIFLYTPAGKRWLEKE
jgi:hypothetical protein